MPNDSLFLRAMRNEITNRPPVWIMRQAGRYLSEYRELKAQHDFLTLCRTPELAVEVSLQPIRYLDVDAAIIFSDILVLGPGMGIEVEFAPGPKVQNPVKSVDDIQALQIQDTQKHCGFVFEALKALRKALAPSKAVVGFSGAPWTLACYFTEQGPYKHFDGTAIFAREEPAAFHDYLNKLTETVTQYVCHQVDAGAETIQIFDSWGGLLSKEDYQKLSLPYLQKIFTALREKNCPSILYINNGGHLLEVIKESGASAVSLDWRTDMNLARAILGKNIILQGNLDPAHLFGTEKQVEEETRNMISAWDTDRGHIVNLGHGILQTTPRENALAFVNAVKQGW